MSFHEGQSSFCLWGTSGELKPLKPENNLSRPHNNVTSCNRSSFLNSLQGAKCRWLGRANELLACSFSTFHVC